MSFPESIQSKEEALSNFYKKTCNDVIALTKIATGSAVLCMAGMSVAMIRNGQTQNFSSSGNALIILSLAVAGGSTVVNGVNDFKNV